MHRLRLLFFVFLSCAIPLQGYAQGLTLAMPCPMMQMDAGVMAASDATDEAHDCCSDADTVAKTGESCKSGPGCQASAQFLPFDGLEILALDRVSSARIPHHEHTVFSFVPAATWRPPASL